MKFFLILTLNTLISVFAFSNTLDFKPIKMAVDVTDTLIVKGFSGQVKLVHDPKSKEIEFKIKQVNPNIQSDEMKSSLDEWNLSLSKKSGQLIAEIKSPSSKSVWSSLLINSEFPKFYLEIKGVSIPTKISWRQGDIFVSDWNSSLDIFLISGTIQIKNCKGDVFVDSKTGKLFVETFEGNLQIDSYSSDLNLINSNGKSEIDLYEGTAIINNFKGQSKIRTGSGSLAISDMNGRLEFETVAGSVKLDKFDGELRGQTDTGTIKGLLVGDADVRLKTSAGDVDLKVPGSGARVNVGSAEGQLHLPSYIHLTRLPNLKWARGRLRGEKKGSIYVRSGDGNIRIR